MRRPRTIGRPRVLPGPLADLKDLAYQLNLEAETPTLDEIDPDRRAWHLAAAAA